jgi:hypothetical protein
MCARGASGQTHEEWEASQTLRDDTGTAPLHPAKRYQHEFNSQKTKQTG